MRPRTIVRRALLAAACLTVVPACGGSTNLVPTSTVLTIAGTYNTAVTLRESTCQGITVQSNPTTVTHTAGATTVTLTHVGNAYTGTVQSNGAFTTSPRAVSGGGETHTLTIAGRFTRTGFDATVTADVVRADNSTCRYVVIWTATRQSGENVIPT